MEVMVRKGGYRAFNDSHRDGTISSMLPSILECQPGNGDKINGGWIKIRALYKGVRKGYWMMTKTSIVTSETT